MNLKPKTFEELKEVNKKLAWFSLALSVVAFIVSVIVCTKL